MKATIIITVLLAISFCRLFGQNIEPAQQPVNYCGNPNYVINSNSAQFIIDTVVTGWMWGSKKIISKALGCTQSDNWYTDSIKNVPDYSNMFVRSNPWQALYCDHGHGASILLARAMVFNPSLEIPDPIIDYYAIANQCNQNNHSSVFGFKIKYYLLI
jgi:hypothetical protein